jgi:hypothetical protein
VSDDVTVEFAGEQFRTRRKVGAIALMRFAKVAKTGGDSATMDGLAAMYDLLEACIAKDEWQRFLSHAADVDADDGELMKVVSDVIELLSGRPTGRPSDSSDGPQTGKASSGGDSSLRVVRRLEDEGRPDKALMVLMAQETRATSAA